MSYSAFSRFGHSSFSSRELLGRKIYLDLRKSLGSSFDQEFDDNPIQAHLFAHAMALARTLYLLKRVRNNAVALKATDLLPVLERIYGLTPAHSASEQERRAALHERMKIMLGGLRAEIQRVIDRELGDGFVAWVRAPFGEAAKPLLIANFSDEDATVDASGNYVSVPNRGSSGGKLNPVSGAGPQRIRGGGRPAALCTTNGGMTVGTSSTFAFLHQQTTVGTIEVDFYLDDPSTGGFIVSTRTTSTHHGFSLDVSAGTLRFFVTNGSLNTISCTGTTIAAGRHRTRILKQAGDFKVYVDDVLRYTASSAALSTASTSTYALAIGSTITDGSKFAGSIFSVDIYPYDTTVGPYDGVSVFPSTLQEAEGLGNYVPPGTPSRILKTTGPVFVGTQSISVKELTGSIGGADALVGTRCVVDPGFIGRQESVVISAVETDDAGYLTSMSASFTKPHDVGTVITFQRFPVWRTNANAHQVIATTATATDPEIRKSFNSEMRRVVRAVSTWELTSQSPMTVGQGLIGISPIGG